MEAGNARATSWNLNADSEDESAVAGDESTGRDMSNLWVRKGLPPNNTLDTGDMAWDPDGAIT